MSSGLSSPSEINNRWDDDKKIPFFPFSLVWNKKLSKISLNSFVLPTQSCRFFLNVYIDSIFHIHKPRIIDFLWSRQYKTEWKWTIKKRRWNWKEGESLSRGKTRCRWRICHGSIFIVAYLFKHKLNSKLVRVLVLYDDVVFYFKNLSFN